MYHVNIIPKEKISPSHQSIKNIFTFHPSDGALLTCPPCSASHWNETWTNKRYFIQNTNAAYGYRVNNRFEKDVCESLGSESGPVMIESQEENDFIVAVMKRYIPDQDSQYFMATAANASAGPYRKWNFQGIPSIYRESGDDVGFWGKAPVSKRICLL